MSGGKLSWWKISKGAKSPGAKFPGVKKIRGKNPVQTVIAGNVQGAK
jgi:hypothetical protein